MRLQKVVVTGGNGFVGCQLTKMLDKRKYEVISVDINSCSDQTDEVKYVEMDLTEAPQDVLSELFRNSTIIHLAAISSSLMCETSPSAAVDVNLKLTMMIAEIANRVNARIIFASSEWVYPDSEVETQLNEDFKLVITAQTNVYAMSKIVGEWAVKKYCRDFQILRFGIVYGERSVPQSAIEKVVFDSINFHRVEVGNVRTARRFIHVQDLCSGIIKSIEDSSGSNILNLTGKRLLSLRDIIKEVEEIIHRRIEIVELSQIPSIRGPSPESFVSRYNWKQQIESSTGIRALVEFYTRQRVGDGNA